MNVSLYLKRNVAWEWKGTLKDWFKKDANKEVSGKTPTKLTNLNADLQLFSHTFDISLKNANSKIRDQLYQLDILDEHTRKNEKPWNTTFIFEVKRLCKVIGKHWSKSRKTSSLNIGAILTPSAWSILEGSIQNLSTMSTADKW